MPESVSAHRETASAKNNSDGNLKSDAGSVAYTTSTTNTKGTTGTTSTYVTGPLSNETKQVPIAGGGVTQASVWGEAHATATHSSFFINFSASDTTRVAYTTITGSFSSTNTTTGTGVATQTDPPYVTNVTINTTTFTSVDQQKASATWYYKPVTTVTTTTSPTSLT